mmetsp:Transcript_13380/g.22777  ORF Transcript_13380/g.22777 Transcript_13380/m.22777 type:complete len:104 (-) Transcript_13380:365-676(-)
MTSVFIEKVRSAKLAGELMGTLNALRLPFGGSTVSLIGFSLGNQVVLSWLEQIAVLQGVDFLNPAPTRSLHLSYVCSVTHLAAAIHYDLEIAMKWSVILDRVV